MSFRLVEGPLPEAPYHCLVTGRPDGEFVDFGDWVAECEIPRVYVRRDVIERAATELLGMVPRVEVDLLRERVEELEKRLIETEQVERALATLEAFTAGHELPESEEVENYGGSS